MLLFQEGDSEIGIEPIKTKLGGKGSSNQELQIGTEKWFVEVVGLSNYGINSPRDLFHIKNGDLLEAFQRKVSHKGYKLAECKSPKVKARMEELWEEIFQCKLPKSGFMPESFIRAVIYEVLYSTNIDWAKLACTKWKAKSRPAKIYRYTEGGEQLTYRKVILHRLESNVEDVGEEIVEVEEK